jgi:hypothetical protein
MPFVGRVHFLHNTVRNGSELDCLNGQLLILVLRWLPEGSQRTFSLGIGALGIGELPLS